MNYPRFLALANDYAREIQSLEMAARPRIAYEATAEMKTSHHVWTKAYDRACHAMTWCDVRRIEYASAAEAIAKKGDA